MWGFSGSKGKSVRVKSTCAKYEVGCYVVVVHVMMMIYMALRR